MYQYILTHLIILSLVEQLHGTSYDLTRGVHPDKLSYYQSISGQTTFTCLDKSSTIPKEAVNDNYCDCGDGSDEPGTSACAIGNFYCRNQGYIPRIIPSGWVNDGECDCCDSSDEYNSTSSCANTCDNLGAIYRRELKIKQEISDRGSEIRSQYKVEAKQKLEQTRDLIQAYKREITEKGDALKKLEDELNSDFGPASVFLPLKDKCFPFRDHEYTYTLCLFDKATQESTTGLQTELGRWVGWAGPQENTYSKQKYEGGIQCWNGPARSTLVNIECGIEDKVTSVTEPSKCEYVFDFMTPAACPDTDPPEEPTTTEQQVPTSELETEEEPTDADHLLEEQIEDPRDLGHDEL